ncbi:MAG TPA: ABC transporter substrate-binding protein [Dehalococcoidia bacterium]
MLDTTWRRLLALPLILLIATLAFAAACNDDDDGGDSETATPTQAADGIDISGVPELADGVLSIGSDIAYAPFEFYEEGTETADGVDIDLAKALAAALGVEAEFINTGWDGIIPALESDDFDALMSAMTITDERSEVIDFVAYITVGTGIVVPAGNPDGVTELADLCGKTVAVQIGTIQVDMLEAQNDDCTDKIEIIVFDTNPLAVEDLRTGGSDANFSDFPVAAEDAAKSDGDLEVVNTQIAPEPYGIGIRKGSTELKGVLEDAMQAIIDDGTYASILAEWDLAAITLQ